MEEWEDYQSNLHNQCFDSANNQGFDRLADNHLGHAMAGTDLTPYVNKVKAAGLPYRFYGGRICRLLLFLLAEWLGDTADRFIHDCSCWRRIWVLHSGPQGYMPH